MPSKTFIINPRKEAIAKDQLRQANFNFTKAPYAFWRAVNKQATVTFYNSGKVVAQGKDIDFLNNILTDETAKPNFLTAKTHIGTDEAGKGDYFGALVVAGVMANKNQQQKLIALGVRDSKNITDNVIAALAPQIKKICPHSVVILKPTRYNKLIAKHRNLNIILANAHAQAIEELLDKQQCDLAIIDQFGNERYIKNALLPKGKKIRITQRHRAESDPVVAAASVLARAAFINEHQIMSKKYKINFPKGAFTVLNAARQFVAQFGRGKLKNVVKIHFKTTRQI